MPELIIRSGKHQGKKLVLPNHDVTIGRDDGCQIRLATNDVSRKHCVLRSTPEGLVLSDLGSRNGTLVNDVRVDSERLLVAGDLIRIGPVVLEVPGGKPPSPAATDTDQAAESASIHAATADEIANWLTDDDEAEFSSSGTTTIMTAAAAAAAGITSDRLKAAGAASGHASANGDPSKKKFKSVAEEAAYIISSWHELLAEEEE